MINWTEVYNQNKHWRFEEDVFSEALVVVLNKYAHIDNQSDMYKILYTCCKNKRHEAWNTKKRETENLEIYKRLSWVNPTVEDDERLDEIFNLLVDRGDLLTAICFFEYLSSEKLKKELAAKIGISQHLFFKYYQLGIDIISKTYNIYKEELVLELQKIKTQIHRKKRNRCYKSCS